jgi:hypothetical protein
MVQRQSKTSQYGTKRVKQRKARYVWRPPLSLATLHRLQAQYVTLTHGAQEPQGGDDD